MHDVAFIMAAGGASTRFGADNKLLKKLDDVPLFLHSLRTASRVIPEARLVITVPKQSEQEFRDAARLYLPGVELHFVIGGATRTESVLNALRSLDTNMIHIVAIHDGARPFLSPQILLDSIQTAREHGAAIVCRKICDTVKSANPDGLIERTIPRDALWAAETPQTFQLQPLLGAYDKASRSQQLFTDDSMVMELFGNRNPRVVENKLPNPKITFQEDLAAVSSRLPLQ